jgi:S-formylglutathione hydrolase FrmB
MGIPPVFCWELTILHNAFRHQNLFSRVGGHMPALELKLEEDAKPYFKDMESWRSYDPISIATENNISDIDVYLDAGNNDEGRFYEGCSMLHEILIEKEINSENYVFSGHHSVEYIQSNLEKYLRFYGK